jgi:hypothetical protein
MVVSEGSGYYQAALALAKMLEDQNRVSIRELPGRVQVEMVAATSYRQFQFQ